MTRCYRCGAEMCTVCVLRFVGTRKDPARRGGYPPRASSLQNLLPSVQFCWPRVEDLKRANDKNPTKLSSRKLIFLPVQPPPKSAGWPRVRAFLGLRAIMRHSKGHRPSCALDCALVDCSVVLHTNGAVAAGVGDHPGALRRRPVITSRW
jgi:hypothetical protein